MFGIEEVHTQGNDPRWNMPYTPALKVHGGSLIFVAGVTAAPVYHSHPHRPEEFTSIPGDAGEQASMALDHLEEVLSAAGASLDDLVQLFRFIVDIDRNQDAINAVLAARMTRRATSTTVEVTRLATDARLVLELTAVAAVPG
ncbi:MAG TPA: RidA family protein [Actinomycetota bacterium]|nr:RidA family protein [Actinomycetota bacterium]